MGKKQPKRALLVLLGILAAAGVCAAQTEAFEQEGLAAREWQGRGLTARHPSLPIGARPRLTNLATGGEVEVTIVERPPGLPTGSVIDISMAAAQALGIVRGDERIAVAAFVPAPPPEPPAAAEPEPAVAEPEPVFIAAEPEPEPAAVAIEPEPDPVPEPMIAVAEPEPPAVAAAPEPPPAAAAAPPPRAAPAPRRQRPVTITIRNYVIVPWALPGECGE